MSPLKLPLFLHFDMPLFSLSSTFPPVCPWPRLLLARNVDFRWDKMASWRSGRLAAWPPGDHLSNRALQA